MSTILKLSIPYKFNLYNKCGKYCIYGTRVRKIRSRYVFLGVVYLSFFAEDGIP